MVQPIRLTPVRLVFLLCSAAWVGPSFGEDWYRFRGPRLDGISSETDWSHDWPDAGSKIVWTANVGVGLSSVSISEGRAYTMGNEDDHDTVYCFDADSGKVLWQETYPSPTDANEFDGGPTSTPTVDGEFVYTLSRGGELSAWNKESGGPSAWSINVASEQAEVRVS